MKFIPYGLHWIDEDDIKEIVQVLKGNWITTGPKIDEFEARLCNYLGNEYAVAVNSGTSALDIAVQTLNLEPGSEIITTPFTFVATSNAILYNSLTPIFADIDKDTRNINPEKIRQKITGKTKAIIYVPYAGHPCDVEEIQQIATEHDLYLIEDASHAFGAEYKGQKIGTFADMTVFSFHPVKHITTGEGGAVVTNDEKLAGTLRMLRNHGIDKTTRERYGSSAGWAYDMKMLGRNYRMTDLQAALGLSQLKRIDGFIEKRDTIARMYTEKFEAIPEIETPVIRPDVRHVWHIYTVLLNDIDRELFFSRMREKNIGVNVLYIPIYRFSYYQEHFDVDPSNYPVTENVFNRIITLPLFPKMNNNEVSYVISSVEKTISECRDE